MSSSVSGNHRKVAGTSAGQIRHLVPLLSSTISIVSCRTILRATGNSGMACKLNVNCAGLGQHETVSRRRTRGALREERPGSLPSTTAPGPYPLLIKLREIRALVPRPPPSRGVRLRVAAPSRVAPQLDQ